MSLPSDPLSQAVVQKLIIIVIRSRHSWLFYSCRTTNTPIIDSPYRTDQDLTLITRISSIVGMLPHHHPILGLHWPFRRHNVPDQPDRHALRVIRHRGRYWRRSPYRSRSHILSHHSSHHRPNQEVCPRNKVRSSSRWTLLSGSDMGPRYKGDRCTIRYSLLHRHLIALHRSCCPGGSDGVLVSRGCRDH